jgi:hypothetical protein
MMQQRRIAEILLPYTKLLSPGVQEHIRKQLSEIGIQL